MEDYYYYFYNFYFSRILNPFQVIANVFATLFETKMAALQKSYKIVFPVIFDPEALHKEKNIRLKFAVEQTFFSFSCQFLGFLTQSDSYCNSCDLKKLNKRKDNIANCSLKLSTLMQISSCWNWGEKWKSDIKAIGACVCCSTKSNFHLH